MTAFRLVFSGNRNLCRATMDYPPPAMPNKIIHNRTDGIDDDAALGIGSGDPGQQRPHAEIEAVEDGEPAKAAED